MSGDVIYAVQQINNSGLSVVSIDMPSGVFDRSNSEDNLHVAIRSTLTLSFQVPKFCFFLPELAEYIGEWRILDIGLCESYIDELSSSYFTYDKHDAKLALIPRPKFGHKGTFGHALVVGGSYGKIGAIALCAEACMRSGAGLTTAYTPQCGNTILQESLPELMLKHPESEQILSGNPGLEGYSAIGIGPGLGTAALTLEMLIHIIESSTIPFVLDADALNLISQEKSLLKKLPKNSILTPHPKEFERLFGTFKSTEERILFMQSFAKENQLNILLKGHFSASALTTGNVYFNLSGNQGMAKGGSGDVLTGIITGLLAQGYAPQVALSLGVFIHGLAGDLASQTIGIDAMLAGDLIDHLGSAFVALRDQE